MAEEANPSRKKNLIPEIDDGLIESGVEIETVYFDPSKMAEYARLVAEAEQKSKPKKAVSVPATSPESSSVPSPPSTDSKSASSVTINNNKHLLLNTNRARLAYPLSKVPKAVPPTDAPPVLVRNNEDKNHSVSSLPGPKVQPLKRKLTEVDGSLKTIFIADSEDQAKKPATPIGFGCAWEGCGYVNKTEGKTTRHVLQSHLEQLETSSAQPSPGYDNKVISRYVYPLYESE